MKRSSIHDPARKPIVIRGIHVVTAVVFLLSIITLAYASSHQEPGYSWLALGASLTPLCWSIGLLAMRRLPRTSGWSSLIHSLGVVLFGSRDSWLALVSIL